MRAEERPTRGPSLKGIAEEQESEFGMKIAMAGFMTDLCFAACIVQGSRRKHSIGVAGQVTGGFYAEDHPVLVVRQSG